MKHLLRYFRIRECFTLSTRIILISNNFAYIQNKHGSDRSLKRTTNITVPFDRDVCSLGCPPLIEFILLSCRWTIIFSVLLRISFLNFWIKSFYVYNVILRRKRPDLIARSLLGKWNFRFLVRSYIVDNF